jgi:hypothetical protein
MSNTTPVRPLWVFAEERSGSSWLTDTLCILLHRNPEYVEMDNEEIDDEEWSATVARDPVKYSDVRCIFQTHRFAILKTVPGAPVLLRTTRREQLEQVLSVLFLDRIKRTSPEFWRLPHVFRSRGPARFRQVVESTAGDTVQEHEIEAYFERKRSRDALWNQYAQRHDTQTIFYEDLFHGVAVPVLGLWLNFPGPSQYVKLPYDKRVLFSNYEQIVEWVQKRESQSG